MNEEIRQALLHLTALRKRVRKGITNRLFASPLIDQKRPMWDDLEQAEKDLPMSIPNVYVWFDPNHARSVRIPRTDQKMQQEGIVTTA